MNFLIRNADDGRVHYPSEPSQYYGYAIVVVLLSMCEYDVPIWCVHMHWYSALYISMYPYINIIDV